MIYHTWERQGTGRVADQETKREKLSSAESSFGENVCEVRPGVDSVKGIGSGSRIRDNTRYVYQSGGSVMRNAAFVRSADTW